MTESQDVKSLATQVAELLEHLRRQAETIRNANLATVQRLDQVAGTVPDAMQQAAEGAIRPVAQQIARQVSGQITDPLDRLQRHVVDIHGRLTGDLDIQQRITRQLQATARWAAIVSVVMAGTMAVLSTAFVWHARDAQAEAARYAVDAAWARTIAEADILPCEGRLCARVDSAAGADAGNDGYVPVRRREAPAP